MRRKLFPALLLVLSISPVRSEARVAAAEMGADYRVLQARMEGVSGVAAEYPVGVRQGAVFTGNELNFQASQERKPSPAAVKKTERKKARRDFWMAAGGIAAAVGSVGAVATIPFIVFLGIGGALPAIAMIAMVVAALGWATLWFADHNL